MKKSLAAFLFASRKCFASAALAFFILSPVSAWACSTVVVGKDASASGNIIVSRTEDSSANNAKRFVVYPAGTYKQGTTLASYTTADMGDYNGFPYTFTRDSYKFTGTPDMLVNESGLYAASGVNEHGLVVSATNTTAQASRVISQDATVPIGLQENFITTILLSEASSVAQALTLFEALMTANGSSEMMVLMVADINEAWIIETLSGHHWVASKIPDDSYAVIANDSVTTYVDLNDRTKYRGDANVYTFLTDNNLAVKNGDGTINLAASYGAINAEGNSYRRWRGYTMFTPSLNLAPKAATDPLPYTLFQKPDNKISVADVMAFQRDRYNGTQYDETKSQQVFNASGSETDAQPRPIGVVTQNEVHIYEMVKSYPGGIGARFWMGMSASEHSPHLPFYGAITDTYSYYKTEASDAAYQANSAFWIFKDLAYRARENREMYGKPIQDYWIQYEQKLINDQANVEKQLLNLYATDITAAEKYITDYTIEQSRLAMDKAAEIRTALIAHVAANPDTLFVVPGTTSGGGNSSSSCNAGFASLALVLLAALPFAFRRKNR